MWDRQKARDIVFRARVGSLDPDNTTFEYLVALRDELNNWVEHTQEALTKIYNEQLEDKE